MNRIIYFFMGISLLVLTVLPPNPALADENSQPEKGLLGATIGDQILDANRGGQVIETNTNNVNATLYDNQATANVTGNNQITSGAFSGANGMSTVIQNSGNNVIIQSATILNLKMQ